jgi:hypothetical protein
MKAPRPLAPVITLAVNVLPRPSLGAYRADLDSLQRAGRLTATQVEARLTQAADMAAVEAGLLRTAA